jgi:hypothetical protein
MVAGVICRQQPADLEGAAGVTSMMDRVLPYLMELSYAGRRFRSPSRTRLASMTRGRSQVEQSREVKMAAKLFSE